MGGRAKLARRKDRGALNARERVALLADDGSWQETGLFAVSHIPALREQTQADGKVTGSRRLTGGPSASLPTTSRSRGDPAATPATGKWPTSRRRRTISASRWCSSANPPGSGCPRSWAAAAWARCQDRNRFLRTRQNPWISGVFGYAFGSAAWHACVADVNVMPPGRSCQCPVPAWWSWRPASGSSRAGARRLRPACHSHGFRGRSPRARGRGHHLHPPLPVLPAVRQQRAAAGNPAAGRLRQLGCRVADLVPAEPARTYDMKLVINELVDPGSLSS